MRHWLSSVLLILLLLPTLAGAQGWSEPTITPDKMTAPLTPPPVTGATFYVDKNNLGGTCNNSFTTTQAQNPATPWCSIAKAASTLTAGQAVLVRAGTYNEGGLRPTNQGTAGNYITFRRYPGENPVVNCTGNPWCLDGWNGTSAYMVWDGFDFTNPNQQFFSTTAPTAWHHVWLINNKFHDVPASNRSTAIDFNGTNFVFSNNEVYNTLNKAVGAGKGGATDIIYEFNHIHNTGFHGDDDGGMKCGDSGTSNCIMRYNLVHDNHRDPSSNEPCFNANPCQGITGLYIDQGWNPSGKMSYIYNNIVYNNDIGIQVWDSQHVRVFNNIVYNNGNATVFPGAHFGYGITIDFGSNADIESSNNTVYSNHNAGLYYGVSPAGGLISRNNISMNNGTYEVDWNSGSANTNANNDLFADSGGGTIIRFNNTNYTSLANFLARGGNTTWLNAVATAATFVSPGLTGSANFHLQSGSAGINQGATLSGFTYDKDNVTRPSGASWDIGAYEFTAATGSPPVVTITAPNSGNNTSVTTSPLTTLTGTASDSDGTVASVAVACSPSCGTPTVIGTTSWSVATLALSTGPNLITVTATDNDGNASQDTITVTLLVTQLRIDAGGNGGTFSDGTYQADAFFGGTGTALDRPGQAIANTTDDVLYASERYGTMTYTLPLQNGTYTVTLKFAEMNATAVGQRLFNVDIQGTRVLTNFDIFALAGANTALDQSFTATVSAGALTIALTTVADNAEIVGIAAVPLVITPAPVVLRLVK